MKDRRHYLDWLRGIAVLIMIEAHTLDSWTRPADRARPEFGWAMILGGFGAPAFLFLAGISLALAAGARVRKGLSEAAAARLARRRSWQIFGLAFLFRLQSWLISGGVFPDSLLKVDILNVMGVAMLAAALCWTLARGARWRAVLLASATVATAMLTPVIRATPLLAWLPDPVEWYLRPAPGRTTFTLLPWAGFLLAGAAIGLWLDSVRTDREERRAIALFAVMGVLIAVGGYAASYLPPLYSQTNFWTSSPTFFFLRLGILITALPIAYLWTSFRPEWSPFSTRLQQFGIASFFVYWIHVEMVYGVASMAIHRRLTFPQALVAFAAFSLFLFGLVQLKNTITAKRAKKTSDPVVVGSGHRASAE